nr:hypothetical protein [Halomonas ventosae]
MHADFDGMGAEACRDLPGLGAGTQGEVIVAAHHLDRLEAGLLEQGQQLLLHRRAHHAFDPEARILVTVHRDRAVDHHVGELQAATRPEYPEHLGHGPALVRYQVEGAVTGDGIEAGVGERQPFR